MPRGEFMNRIRGVPGFLVGFLGLLTGTDAARLLMFGVSEPGWTRLDAFLVDLQLFGAAAVVGTLEHLVVRMKARPARASRWFEARSIVAGAAVPIVYFLLLSLGGVNSSVLGNWLRSAALVWLALGAFFSTVLAYDGWHDLPPKEVGSSGSS